MLEIKRAEKIVVEGLDRDGKEISFEAKDLLARVLQHEIDHLGGTLIIDRVSKVHRQLISGKLKKLRREYDEVWRRYSKNISCHLQILSHRLSKHEQEYVCSIKVIMV